MNNTGTLVQIIGAVVDADFSRSETLPALLNALEVDYEINGQRKTLVLEVQQHIGDGWVRAVAMSSTDGLRRGMPCAIWDIPSKCRWDRAFWAASSMFWVSPWTSGASLTAPG